MQYPTYAVPRADLAGALIETAVDPGKNIAEIVFPVVPVANESATYPVIKREASLAIPDAIRGEDGGYNRVEPQAEDATYKTIEYGLEGPIDDKKVARYKNDFDLEMITTRNTWGNILLKIETDAKNALFNTTTFTGSDLYTDVSSAPWDEAASDVIGQVQDGIEKVMINSGNVPNALIIGYPTLKNLKSNTAIIARFPGIPVLTDDVLVAGLPSILGIERIIVGRATYNTAKEGQAFSGAWLWGDDYAMIAYLEEGMMDLGGLGRTLVWEEDGGALTVETYREEQKRGGIVRVRTNRVCKFVDVASGHLLKVDA